MIAIHKASRNIEGRGPRYDKKNLNNWLYIFFSLVDF
jgi:hypothetical protein